MAPRSQEPQFFTKDVEQKDDSKKYIATISFTVSTQNKGTITYIFEGKEEEIEDKAKEQFERDFPFGGVVITISVAELQNEQLQKCTDKKKIIKLIKEYIESQEKSAPNKKLKFMGKLTSINNIKEFYGFTKKKISDIESPKELDDVELTVKAGNEIQKKVVPSWYAEYNIKLGDVKYRKGTKIENVDNEIDARKQLDIYIKRTFSRIRSVTKVTLKEWNGEEDFSEEIIEKIAPIKEVEEPITKSKTLDEIIKESFSEETLNDRAIQVVLKPTKIKQKDFEENFLLYKDEGQTDNELFQEIKKECPPLRKKNFATKRLRFRQILTTQEFKMILLSSKFQNAIAEGEDGLDTLLSMRLEMAKENAKKGNLSGKIIDSITDRIWNHLDGIRKFS